MEGYPIQLGNAGQRDDSSPNLLLLGSHHASQNGLIYLFSVSPLANINSVVSFVHCCIPASKTVSGKQ